MTMLNLKSDSLQRGFKMATNLIDAELASPFQNAPTPGPGLNLMAGIQAVPEAIEVGQAVEKKAEQRAFEDLLATGQEGMVKMSESLLAEGSITPQDAAKLDPNNALFQGEEGQIKWYQGIDRAIKENQATKLNKKKATLEGEELVEVGVEAGEIGVESQLGLQKGFRREERVEEFMKNLGSNESTNLSVDKDETDAVVLQGVKDSIDEKIENANQTGIADDPGIASMIKGWQKQKADLDKRIRESNTERRSARGLASREAEADTKAGEKFIKDTVEARATQVQMDTVSQALVEMGLPDGVNTFDPGIVDIPGAGKLGTKLTRFVKTPAGIKFVANVERLISMERHKLYGAALTDTENANFKRMTGQNWLGNEMQFLAALRAIERVNKLSLQGSRRQEAAAEDTRRRNAPPPKKEKAKSTSSLSDDDIFNSVFGEK